MSALYAIAATVLFVFNLGADVGGAPASFTAPMMLFTWCLLIAALVKEVAAR
jgi:hypothetical protein